MLTIRAVSCIIPIAHLRNGGIAQLARACGSYPQCPRFESRCRYQKRRRYYYLRLNLGPLVKRLRHRPFTAVTWVRFPYGSPKNTAHRMVGCVFYALRESKGAGVNDVPFVMPRCAAHVAAERLQMLPHPQKKRQNRPDWQN